ncbi:hypothetical protein HDU79_004289 [Rhizoclosmatium sp. JEL0117]|nr:hypothetical protein HDU79_004289 [Rhizoclosmatium sp. JEL0117]
MAATTATTSTTRRFPVSLATSPAQLEQINGLAHANLNTNVSAETASTQGFLSVAYPLSLLNEMLLTTPPLIALSSPSSVEHTPEQQHHHQQHPQTVVAYALAATPQLAHTNPFLAEAAAFLETEAILDGAPVKNLNYLLMAQICVAEEARGCGVVNDLYDAFKREYGGKYDFLFTEVRKENARSLKAHLKAGWRVFGTWKSTTTDSLWDTIVLDLRK